MKANAGSLKKGDIIEIGNQLWQIVSTDHNFRGRGSANIKIKIKNIKSNQVLEKSFRPNENVNLVDIADIFKKKRSKELYAEIDRVINIYFHPSKKGNEIIAQEIIAEMRKMGIL